MMQGEREYQTYDQKDIEKGKPVMNQAKKRFTGG
jgi:hypothetical protein